MKVFYLFNISNVNKDLFENKNYYLYNILKEIKDLDRKYIYYANYLYLSLCLPIDKEKLDRRIFLDSHTMYSYKKIKDKHIYNDLYLNEDSTLIINKLFMKIITNKDDNYFFKILNELNINLFVVDFKNKDYFFLTNIKALI